jgi:hypothetical protein
MADFKRAKGFVREAQEMASRLTAEHDGDTAEIRALLEVARDLGPGHHEFAGLVRGAEILRTIDV